LRYNLVIVFSVAPVLVKENFPCKHSMHFRVQSQSRTNIIYDYADIVKLPHS